MINVDLVHSSRKDKPDKTCLLKDMPNIHQTSPTYILDNLSGYFLNFRKDKESVFEIKLEVAGSCCGGHVVHMKNSGLTDAEQHEVWEQFVQLMKNTKKSLLFITGYFPKKEYTEILPHYQLSQVVL